MATAKQRAQWKKWQVAGAAKRKGGMGPGAQVALWDAQRKSAAKRRKHGAMAHGYGKLLLHMSKVGGANKSKYKKAARRLMSKMIKNSKGMYENM